jgi:hypothetical protein
MASASRLSAAPASRVSAPPPITVPSFARSSSTGDARMPAAPALRLAPGKPLAPAMRRKLEHTFRADLGRVRVQRNAPAAAGLGARAFAFGSDVVLGRQARDDDVGLMAHEVAHTLQQGSGRQVQPFSPSGGGSLESEARQAGIAATNGARFTVTGQTSGPHVQREEEGDESTVLSFFADKANLIPGFRMLTIVLGVNPISMSAVSRSAANILRAIIEILPMGGLITQALDSSGVFEKAGTFVESQLAAFGDIGAAIKQAIRNFIAGFSGWDLFRPWRLWDRAKRIFTDPISQIIDFAKGLVGGIVDLIKDAILRPIAKLAEGTEGYALLKAVMGKDPITGDPVPQTAEAIIGPFMKMIGQGEIWENMQKAKAIPRAFAWFKTALGELMGFVNEIPGLFVSAFKSLKLVDIVLVPLAFSKLVKVFGSFLGRFITWGGNTIWNLLEIIFAVVAPGVMPYLAKAKAAFKTILKDPVVFVGNLVRAGRLGFELFASNIVTHLKDALIKWITGPLGAAGVYIPKSFSLIEIVKLVLSVLGLTWQNIRAKLVKIIPEPVLGALEKTAGILVTLVKDGPAAAWEQIKAELNDLKSQLISQVTQMITVEVVKAAVVKLVSMLNPVGAFVQAILAIYNTITFFIEKINQIGAVVASFIDSISAIASGLVGSAAKKVEQTMANMLTVIIAFLAKFAGVGNIPQKLVGIVKKIRQPIDKALDKIVVWLGNILKKAVGAAKAGIKKLFQWWKKKAPFSGGGESHSVLFEGEETNARLMVHSVAKKPEHFILDYVPTKGGDTEIASIKKLTAEIDSFKKTIAAAQKKEPPNEASIADLDKKLTDKFNALGTALAALLNKAADEGSEKNPVPIVYPKRRAAAYPNIYIGPLTSLPLEQSWLKAAAGGGSLQKSKDILAAKEPKLINEASFANWSGAVIVLRAAAGPSQPLPVGGPVGLDPAFASLAPGKVLVYDDKGRTGGGSKINNEFKPFGFRPGKERMDGDHVMERQLGGPDALSNLWPLDAGENRSSGSTIKSMKITFKNRALTVHEARLARKNKPLNLLITGVR